MKKPLTFWKAFFASLLAFVAFQIISFILGIMMLITMLASFSVSEPAVVVKDNSILKLELTGDIPDRKCDDPFANMGFLNALSGKEMLSLEQIKTALSAAKDDPKIKGVHIELLGVSAGYASLKEVRDAILDFKTSGKFVYAYGDAYAQSDYYLASAADSVFLHNEGLVEIKGLSAQFVSYKKFMEKIGVDMQIIRHGKFKAAVEPFFLEKMSEENRLQTQKYIDGIWGIVSKEIAGARHCSVEDFDKIIDQNPFCNAKDAVALGLIDRTVSRIDVTELLMASVGVEKEKNLKEIGISAYAKQAKLQDNNKSKNRIAVIYANGEIKNGDGDDQTIADNIVDAIHDAVNNDKVKAIVLRVNSPGGSALQSEFIYDEIIRAKAKKPVVASFANYAASGGYYISCACNYIVCNPNCLTGSIGVFGTIPNAQKLVSDKLGFKFETVNTNEHSDFMSAVRPMTDFERAKMQNHVEQTYDVFISHVADGRGKTKEAIDEIGQGRVWAGVDALEIGLIDQFGTLDDAIAKAVELAEVEDYKLVALPKADDFMTKFLKKSGSIKQQVLINEMGDFYKLYQTAKNVSEQSGVQARLPYYIVVR
ncbi:signal peptide peptidase SppA [Bacteroidia bacterium]|nr:signal peptide peptidase SppA [Bacteroidia bacterium]